MIAGVLAFIIGIDYLGEISGAPTYITATGYLIIVLGLGSIIYGAKRLVDDVKKAACNESSFLS